MLRPQRLSLRLLHLLLGDLLIKVLLELREKALVRLVTLGACDEVQRALADAKEMLHLKMPQVRLRRSYVGAQRCLQVDLAAQKALEERACQQLGGAIWPSWQWRQLTTLGHYPIAEKSNTVFHDSSLRDVAKLQALAPRRDIAAYRGRRGLPTLPR